MLRMGVSVGCGNRSDAGIVSSTWLRASPLGKIVKGVFLSTQNWRIVSLEAHQKNLMK
jgi:hypothetical protein